MQKKKKSNLLKWLIITVVVLIIFAVIGKKAGWIGGAEKKQVATEKVTKQDIIEVVSASGKIQPEVEVKISPDVSGEIVELNVKEGDRVKKGQLLAKILPDIYQSYLDRANAALNSSKANLENARSRKLQAESQLERSRLTYERNQKLYNEKLISSSDWETVKSAYEVAKAEVDAASQNVSASDFGVRSSEATVKESQDNLRKTTIFAPVDGTISKLGVEKGERVVGTSQMAGTEMFVLADLNEMEVNVDVNENDIVRVHVGDTAIIEVDAYIGKKFKGVVTEVANSANVSGLSVDQVTNFTVKVRVLRESYLDIIDKDHPERNVFNPGMSATVDIRTKRVSNVLSVPIQSVTTRDTTGNMGSGKGKLDSGEMSDQTDIEVKDTKEKAGEVEKKEVECVFVVEDGKVKLVPVEIGIQDNNHIEIKSGLKEGQVIVSAPYSMIAKTLKNEDLVEIVDKDKLYSAEKK
ncbi:MAG TPA: efflux RND transporter periplasmic adaptor subunit [Bacteroidia bacterium]|nr:efflux RND transporter periplasmic adaptor subunit [Bacteroidota bacterium]MBK8585118.1 efflux RND transporter periplasmic adaptor subunit [Bacteroidota bacterium]MBP9790344.1 efflux RND transporter periplasmic adaptor subunit [Bacteroidia bacterium]MBP9923500.1 efflux RND transporter periplasmic adaptor subunit [Bacteroidia bacterium]HQW23379.1 efflux RND transporter periplasmic adaptor subunit [Bacteroidia bacterium]